MTRGPTAEEAAATTAAGSEAAPPSAVAVDSPAQTSGPATGTAPSATAGLTTLLAGPAASSVGPTRRSPDRVAGMTVMAWAGLAGSGSAVAVAVVVVAGAAALGGSPVIGFALGRDATSITLLVGPSALDAVHQETLAANLPINHQSSLNYSHKLMNLVKQC